jgi:hypothetical protein
MTTGVPTATLEEPFAGMCILMQLCDWEQLIDASFGVP